MNLGGQMRAGLCLPAVAWQPSSVSGVAFLAEVV
jgi:hypothetical protein